MNESSPSPFTRINIKLLQTFMLVAEHNSFRIAAERACRSQSAVSAQIRALEQQVGVPLFHRTTRRVRLTAEGEQLLVSVSQAFQGLDAGLRKLQETAQLQQGRVSLSCSPTIADTRLARVLAAFSHEHPNVHIRVRELTSAALLASVRSLEADIGVGPVTDAKEFLFEPLLTDPLYALVPRRFLQGRKRSISLSALAKMPVLLLNHATALRSQLDEALREQQLTFDTRYEFAQAQSLVSMATAGLGAAILPGITVPANLEDSVACLRIVRPALTRQIAIITLRGQSLSPAAVRLADALREQWHQEVVS